MSGQRVALISGQELPFVVFFLFHCWGEESSAKVCSDVAEEGR